MRFIHKVLAAQSEYVIKKGAKFWTGQGWSDEYPDAKVFRNENDAKKVRDTVLKGAGDIYKDYGLEHEDIVA